MQAFHTSICSFQGGSNYQGIRHNYVLSGTQPSHQSYPPVQNVSQSAPLVMPNTYQLANLNGNNQITLTGVNGPVNTLPCLNQSTNFMPLIVNNTNSISYNYNGQIMPIQNSQALPVNMIPQNQILLYQKINTGRSNFNRSGVTINGTEKIIKKVGKGGNNNGRKTEEKTASIEAIGAREKIGNMSMDVTPIYPVHNIPARKILDLNIMGCLFQIKILNVNLHSRISYKAKFLDALKQIIGNKTLLYWFILKCEEKQMSVFQSNVCVELYQVDNFETLFEVIDKESCLPLPFITKGVGNIKKYFYINLMKGSHDKVQKLNASIFCDVNERKKIMCRYPGIKLHCTFSENIKDLTIHIHESAMSAYQSSKGHVRELIIYKHVIWGFLQAWIRRIRKHFKDFFTEEQISKNLFLQQMEERNGNIIPENENIPIYLIGYSNFYLKFDPVNSKQARDSFSVKNFETKFVCDVPVVQYYRQFFLLNDIHSMHVLNHVVLFFTRKSGRTVVRDEQNSSQNKTLQEGEKPLIISSVPQKIQIIPSQCNRFRIDHPSSSSGANFSRTETNNEETCDSYFSWHTSERAENSVNNQEGGNSTEPKEQTVVHTPQMPLVRPLLKTRTVEEINSSIEANKRLGFYPINFDSVGNFDVKTDTRNQLKQEKLATLVQEALQNSYSLNASEITTLDETNDENIISKRFKEALDKAMDRNSLESFIGAMYVNLKLHFTNSTSQKILNTMIERAMKKKYPGFKNIVTGSQSLLQTYIDKPSTENQPRLLEMVKEALATEKNSLDLIQKTTIESGNSCVPLNLPEKENSQSVSSEKVIFREQMKKNTNVEPGPSKPSENVQSNNSEILSNEKEASKTEPCLLFKKDVERAEPNTLGKDFLPSSKDDNSSTLDKEVEFKCKTEVMEFVTNTQGGEEASEERSISALCENIKTSDSIKTEPENEVELGAHTNKTSQPDSKQRSVTINAHGIRKFNGSLDEGGKDNGNNSGVLDSLQLSHEMKKHVVDTKSEPKKKKRKRNDSDVEIGEIRARALERLRKRSGKLEASPTKNITKRKPNEIVKNSEKKFGEYEEAKENNFLQGNRFKKELKILLRRLEDVPEYKKYVENYGPNLNFKVKKVKFKNKDRLESFKIVGIQSL